MTKQSLIMIPGLLCSPRLWTRQITALSDIAECTVGDHTRHSLMGEIAKSILDKAPERFALAGLSMGGYISFEIMRQAPERVERLALLDTSALADSEDAREIRKARIAHVQKNGIEQFIANDWLEQMAPLAKKDDENLKKEVTSMAMEVGEDAFIRQQTAIMSRRDSRSICKKITCPTTIIVGALDDVTPLERHQEIHKLISGAKLHVIPGCGHLSTLEAPEETSSLLRSWLKD